MICFLIYTAIDWQGIHTAMITCYVAALGTTGETVHKLALRITGCLIGAALGVAAIFWVIPQIDGVGALMVLVFLGCLVGAWVSTGPERIAYAGVQVALAFLLTVLQGFGPSVSLDTAQDRIVGILLGNLVVYLIFTRIWPAPVEGEVRALFARALSGLAWIARLPPARRTDAVSSAAEIESLAGRCQEALRLLPFEPRELRPTPKREQALHGAVTEIETLNRSIWLSRDTNLEQIADRLDRLAERFHKPAEEETDGHPDSGPPEPPAQRAGLAPIGTPFSHPLSQLEGAAGSQATRLQLVVRSTPCLRSPRHSRCRAAPPTQPTWHPRHPTSPGRLGAMRRPASGVSRVQVRPHQGAGLQTSASPLIQHGLSSCCPKGWGRTAAMGCLS